MKLTTESFPIAEVAKTVSTQGLGRKGGSACKKFDLFQLSEVSRAADLCPKLSDDSDDSNDNALQEKTSCIRPEKKLRILVNVTGSVNIAFEGASSNKYAIPAHYQMTGVQIFKNARCFAAGNIGVDANNKINFISNKSGDFHPGIASLAWIIQAILGIDPQLLAENITIEVHGGLVVTQAGYTREELENLISLDVRNYCNSLLNYNSSPSKSVGASLLTGKKRGLLDIKSTVCTSLFHNKSQKTVADTNASNVDKIDGLTETALSFCPKI